MEVKESKMKSTFKRQTIMRRWEKNKHPQQDIFFQNFCMEEVSHQKRRSLATNVPLDSQTSDEDTVNVYYESSVLSFCSSFSSSLLAAAVSSI